MKMDNNRVFLIRNVAPGLYGGGETYQLLLAKMLKNAGYEPYIVTASRELLCEARRQKVKTIRSPYIKKQNWSGWRNILFPIYYLKIIKLQKWYKQIIKKYRPAIINIQSRDDWIAATGVARVANIKVLWTDHMDFRSWVLQNVDVWYKNWIGKWILRKAKLVDKIIMISDFERQSFERIVMPRKFNNLITIKNGVEDKNKEYEKTKPIQKSFIYLGRIVDYKGIKELIEAFLIVAKKNPTVKLNIYGDGKDLEKYKKLVNKNKMIRFYGQTDEPLRALAENEIFILPSYREGLSLSLLDAVMMGKKIIASDVDGNPEVVKNGKTGLLVPPKNVEKLAEAMIYMLENRKEVDRMAKNARKYYEENFDFDKIFVEKMLPLYNNEEN